MVVAVDLVPEMEEVVKVGVDWVAVMVLVDLGLEVVVNWVDLGDVMDSWVEEL